MPGCEDVTECENIDIDSANRAYHIQKLEIKFELNPFQ